MDNVTLYVFGNEVDLEAIVAEVGPDWRAVFETLSRELDIIDAVMMDRDEHLTGLIDLKLFGEDVDLEPIYVTAGRDWRAMFEKLAPELDRVFSLADVGR